MVRFEKLRTHRRREDQGDEKRQHHRRNNRDRELFVDDPRRPIHEGHRQEHSRKHHHDPDERRGNLPHALFRGGDGVQPFFFHHPFDVLDNNNRVIDQQTNGQDQCEHGKGVD